MSKQTDLRDLMRKTQVLSADQKAAVEKVIAAPEFKGWALAHFYPATTGVVQLTMSDRKGGLVRLTVEVKPQVKPTSIVSAVQEHITRSKHLKESVLLSNPKSPALADKYAEESVGELDEVVFLSIIDLATNQNIIIDITSGLTKNEILDQIENNWFANLRKGTEAFLWNGELTLLKNCPDFKGAQLREAFARDDGTAKWIFR